MRNKNSNVLKRLLDKIRKTDTSNPLYYFIAGAVLILVIFSFSRHLYFGRDFMKNIFIEAHGMLFDIIMFGIILMIINNRRNKKLEIKRYTDEIDDFKEWESDEAVVRITGNIIRLLGKGLKGLDLSSSYLVKAKLNNKNLEKCIFTSANLEGADFVRATLSETNFTNANLFKSNLIWANLLRANFSHANLAKANLTGANLVMANLEESLLLEAKLNESQLANANLTKAYLPYSDLKKANLSGANLQDANFTGANLEMVNMKDANISLYQLKDVESMTGAIMPDGSKFNNEWSKKIEESKVPENNGYYVV